MAANQKKVEFKRVESKQLVLNQSYTKSQNERFEVCMIHRCSVRESGAVHFNLTVTLNKIIKLSRHLRSNVEAAHFDFY